jgi:hypothetical protein
VSLLLKLNVSHSVDEAHIVWPPLATVLLLEVGRSALTRAPLGVGAAASPADCRT